MFGNIVKQKKFKTSEGKEIEVTIYLLKALKGLNMSRKLSTVLLPVLGSFMSPMEDGNEDSTIDFTNIAQTLVEGVEKIDVESIISDLLHGLVIDGQDVTIDDYFVGNYGLLLEIVAYALEENFSSFFTSSVFKNLSGKLPALQVDTTKQS